MFEIKAVTVKDRKTGRRKTRYYAEVYLSSGLTIPLILGEPARNCTKKGR